MDQVTWEFGQDLTLAMVADMGRGGGSRAELKKSNGFRFFRRTGDGTGAAGVANPKKGQRRTTKLTEDSVREIRVLRAGGMARGDIAVRFGVSEGAVNKVIYGIQWKHVR